MVVCSLVLSANAMTRPVRKAMRQMGIHGISPGKPIEFPWRRWTWTRQGEDEPWAAVEFQLVLEAFGGTTRLRYEVDHFSKPTWPQRQSIDMVITPCRFGGVRWWWICPATRRRVDKLYLPNGGMRFLSRGPGAHRLAYASQRHRRVDRMHDRSRRLYRLLGADYEGQCDERWPPKPKWMRWRTYNAICDQLGAEAYGLNVDMVRVMRRLTRRC